MKDDREPIKLNDILQLTAEQLENTKIRFMVSNDDINFNPNSETKINVNTLLQ